MQQVAERGRSAKDVAELGRLAKKARGSKWASPSALERSCAEALASGDSGPIVNALALALVDLSSECVHQALSRGDGARLRDGLAALTRIRWFELREALTRGESVYAYVWLLLDAAAAGDRGLYEALMALLPRRIEAGHRVPLAVFHALRCAREGALDDADACLQDELLRHKTDRYSQHLGGGLSAVFRGDVVDFARATSALATGWRRKRNQHIPAARKFVAVHVHALLRLAQWLRPELALVVAPPEHRDVHPMLEAAVAARGEPRLTLGDAIDRAAPEALQLLRSLPRASAPSPASARAPSTSFELCCERCEKVAVRFAPGEVAGSEGFVFHGLTHRQVVPANDVATVMAMLSQKKIAELHAYLSAGHALSEGIDAFCPRCDAIYCGDHMDTRMTFDEGFYDCTYGTCPLGHERMIDD
jgi:hypothetical protein